MAATNTIPAGFIMKIIVQFCFEKIRTQGLSGLMLQAEYRTFYRCAMLLFLIRITVCVTVSPKGDNPQFRELGFLKFAFISILN